MILTILFRNWLWMHFRHNWIVHLKGVFNKKLLCPLNSMSKTCSYNSDLKQQIYLYIIQIILLWIIHLFYRNNIWIFIDVCKILSFLNIICSNIFFFNKNVTSFQNDCNVFVCNQPQKMLICCFVMFWWIVTLVSFWNFKLIIDVKAGLNLVWNSMCFMNWYSCIFSWWTTSSGTHGC